MRNRSLYQTKIAHYLLLATLLLAACGAPAAVEPEAPPDIAEPGIAQPETPPDQSPAQAAALPEGEVRLDDMIYPGAEFLFEIPGFGGPMVPWRYYALHGVSMEQAIAYYQERLPHFNVEYDQVANGQRNLLLVHPSPMAQLNNVQGQDDMARIGRELDGSLLGVEISHSNAHTHQNRLGIAIQEGGRGDEIPDNTTILIMDYFANPF